MTGLREKKKIDRKSRIQGAAIKLFDYAGFEATTMNRIAEEANLGVGTLYNYYKSKGELLLSIIEDRTDAFLPDFDDSIKNRSGDVLAAINGFQDIYFHSFSTYSKRIWREFISNMLTKQPSMMDYISKIDSIYLSKFAELLTQLKSDSLLKENTEVENVVLTLYSIMIFHVFKYILDEGMTMESLQASLNKQTGLVVKGLQI